MTCKAFLFLMQMLAQTIFFYLPLEFVPFDSYDLHQPANLVPAFEDPLNEPDTVFKNRPYPGNCCPSRSAHSPAEWSRSSCLSSTQLWYLRQYCSVYQLYSR